ncbi:Nif3-like dinuclear metal center hexameric protein [Kaarinaea lacus]
MVLRDELITYLDELLNVSAFDDYCPNGLQVEGRHEISSVIGGVTASQELINAGIHHGADTLLVHHGYFWKGEDPRVIGMKRRRLASLLDAGMNVLAYHLPLDAHPELGNNAQLASRLGLNITGTFGRGAGPDVGMVGELPEQVTAEAFASQVAEKLGREPLLIPGGKEIIHSIAWCTGAAQGYLESAAALGVDAFLTGEVSEQTVHEARELGIHFISAGHHATERGGVMALGTHLADRFGISFRFEDIDNPV